MGICGSKSRNKEEKYEEEAFTRAKTEHIVEHKGSITQTYRLDKLLGKGGFGQVWSAFLIKDPEVKRAVKVIFKDKADFEEIVKIKEEVKILSKLDHPNIIKFYEFFEDSRKLYIVSEICEGGELFDRIQAKKKFDESDARLIMKQLLSAVKFCHIHGIIHRDLKPENVVFTDEGFNSLKVIDFGASIQYSINSVIREKIGTPYYIAPEVLKRNYDKKCDVWSAGVMLYILLSGYPPFNGRSTEKIMEKVLVGKFNMERQEFTSISSDAKDLIVKMLTYDKDKRPTVTDVLEHPWFKKAGDNETAIDKATLENFKAFNVYHLYKNSHVQS